MSISPEGEPVSPVKEEVRRLIGELRSKMGGIGVKTPNPHEKIAEVKEVLKNLKQLQQLQKEDGYFSSDEYKILIQGLNHILKVTQQALSNSNSRR